MQSLYRYFARNMRGKKGQSGFTLIELLVVVTILGVLAAIVTLSLVGLTTNAQAKACEQESPPDPEPQERHHHHHPAGSLHGQRGHPDGGATAGTMSPPKQVAANRNQVEQVQLPAARPAVRSWMHQ